MKYIYLPPGSRDRYSIDLSGDRVAITDPEGNVTLWDYEFQAMLFADYLSRKDAK